MKRLSFERYRLYFEPCLSLGMTIGRDIRWFDENEDLNAPTMRTGHYFFLSLIWVRFAVWLYDPLVEATDE